MDSLSAALLVLVAAVQFAALGLFYHLFTRRFDLMSETHARQMSDLADELRRVSPVQAYQRISDMQADLGRVWQQIAAMSGRDVAREEEVRQLSAGFETLSHVVTDKVDGFYRDLSREIKEIHDQLGAGGKRASPAQVI